MNRPQLEEEIRAAINRASAENESNTPDFILAKYLLACLDAHTHASREREAWYRVAHGPNAASLPGPAVFITKEPDAAAHTPTPTRPYSVQCFACKAWFGPFETTQSMEVAYTAHQKARHQ